MSDRITVVDIGSGSMKASVFVNTDGYLKSLEVLSRGLRLCTKIGEDISAQKQHETIEFLKKVVSISEKHHSDKIIAVATQAARNASNFKDVHQKILENTGIDLQTLSGNSEAELNARCVKKLMHLDRFVSFDMGCGSIEFADVKGKIDRIWSVPISIINLAKRHTYRNIHSFVFKTLDKTGLSVLCGQECPLIGCGGTLKVANSFLTQGKATFLSYDDLQNLFDHIKNKSFKERVSMGIPKMRADVLPYGIVVILNIMKFVQADRVYLSASSLRMSVAFDHFKILQDE